MNENFSSHHLETGLLQRVRSWSDLWPALILLRSLRVCGSPIYVSLALVIWLFGATLHSAYSQNFANLSLHRLDLLTFFSEIRLLERVLPNLSTGVNLGAVGLFVLGLAISTLPAAVIIRAGGLYAAGREPVSVREGIHFIARRMGSLLTATLLPMVCISGLVLPILAVALLDRIPTLGDFVAEGVAILVTPLLVLLGMIAAGSLSAVPLAWTTIAIEKKQDPFDALSRGYEYTFRRPVQCLVYLGLSLLLAEWMSFMARAICLSSTLISARVYSIASGGEPLPISMRIVLTHLPHAVWLTAILALLGATYLLLRKSANQQEIEDVAVSPIDTRKSELPSLQAKA